MALFDGAYWRINGVENSLMVENGVIIVRGESFVKSYSAVQAGGNSAGRALTAGNVWYTCASDGSYGGHATNLAGVELLATAIFSFGRLQSPGHISIRRMLSSIGDLTRGGDNRSTYSTLSLGAGS